jgi:hypothetical protein
MGSLQLITAVNIINRLAMGCAVRLFRIIQVPHLIPELCCIHRNMFVQLEQIVQVCVFVDQSAEYGVLLKLQNGVSCLRRTCYRG